MEKKISKLKELAEKGKDGTQYTSSEKAFIRTLSKEKNIEFIIKPSCKNCYFDQVMKLLNINTIEKIDAGKSHPPYILREPYASNGMYINGTVYVSQATLTNKIAEYMIKNGLGHFFVKKS